MKRKVIYALGGMILTVALFLNPALAQIDQTQDQQQPEQTEQQPGRILPLIYELSANPGETVSQTIVVTNNKDEDMQIQAAVLDFEVVSEEGGVRFTNIVKDEHRLAGWVKVSEPAFRLKKNETKRVDFEVSVPKDAEVGAHWAMVFFQGFNVKGEKTIETIAGSNAFIFLTVQGVRLKESATVKSFTAEKSDEEGALSIILRISNLGNNIVKPRGTLTIYNLWGKKIDEISLSTVVVVPNSIGKIVTEWKPEKGLSLGRYKIMLKGYYGTENVEFNAKTAVWILPWEVGWAKYVLYVLAGLIVIYLILRVFKFKLTIIKT